jgi:hypothetical protein
MSRNVILWTIVLFMGGSILFGALRRWTDGESALVTWGVQIGALTIICIGLAIFVRRQSD